MATKKAYKENNEEQDNLTDNALEMKIMPGVGG